MAEEFTHLTESGVHMVEVGGKPDQKRRAIASGSIFLDENTTGDGLLSALHLLQVMVETGKPLSELASIMEVLPQALVNAKVANHKKERYMEYPEIAKAIDELTAKFAGEGRVLIRPSGTEPLVRVMIEGKDKEQIQEEAEKLAVLIQDIMF